jgi:hypothetical protein
MKSLAGRACAAYGRLVPVRTVSLTGPGAAAADGPAVEIACDESGFTGGNLTFPQTVFAHASLRISREAATEEMERLRRRVSAHGELKASWLLRWCEHRDLVRLLGPQGVVDRALVHLTDTRLFLLARLCDALLGVGEVDGLDLPGEQVSVRSTALQLHRHGEDVFGCPRWQRFLVAAGNVLRTNSRWIPATAVADFELSVAELASSPAPPEVREELRRLRASASRARAVRRSLEADARRPPLLEPLLPALTRAILRWGADHPMLVVLHDEQSALTRWRLAEIATELDRQHPGHTFHLDRIDSRKDPRVQIADLVAGIARRAARGSLTGQAEDELLDLVRPLIDPRSIWADDAWLQNLPSGQFF